MDHLEFELEPFLKQHKLLQRLLQILLTKAARSIAGGGDAVAALNKSGTKHNFTYVSDAGSAFLEWMEGKKLPALNAITKQTLILYDGT